MHRQLVQLRNLFHRLDARLTAHNAVIATNIRVLAQKLDALDSEIGSLGERSRLLLDEIDTKMTAITNRRLHTLSVLTAVLLPPTLVTGFFGMNTKDLPFQNTDDGTWMAASVALGAALACYWALRRLRAF